MTEALQTDTPETGETALITFTDEAAERMQAAIEETGKQVDAIRLIAQQGGCCGMQYAMAFAQGEPHDIEAVVDTGAVPLYLDKALLDVMEGTTIGWVEDMRGSGFHIDNPNVDGGSCGCQ